MSAGSESLTSEALFVPTRQEPDGDQMSSPLEGTLREIDNCLFVEAAKEPTRTLVIWPFGTTGDTDPEGVSHLYDEDGQIVATAGSPIELGGGYIQRGAIRCRLA